MQNKQTTYLFLAVIALTALSIFGYLNTKYVYGIDIRGGARFTYQMELDSLKADQKQNVEQIKSNTLHVMENRVTTGLGVAEAAVQLKGKDQIIIELPGETDLRKAEETIGTSASIKLYHAKTVKTKLASYRKYDATSNKSDSNPEVEFITNSGKTIGFTDPATKKANPEYADIIKSWDLILEGDDLASAGVAPYGNAWQPTMTFSDKGGIKLESFTKRTMNQGENIAFVLDGKVLSIAPVQDGTVLKDNAIINGSFTQAYCSSLAGLLNSGALPVELKKVSEETVDPTIGGTALNQIVTAGLIAFGVICAFLLIYYGWPGFVATLALVLYCLFTLTVLKAIHATFSLAGIAGFILSVGMAVDANILVFERFKEEAAGGKKLLTAMQLGFKRALPAIVDSNLCTVLTSLVLAYLGTGPVKGFASTLIIGVVISFFTAVTVSRTLLLVFADSFAKNESWYALHRQWFKRVDTQNFEPLRVLSKSKRWFSISILTIIPGIIFVFTGGFKPNVEFRGGYEAQFSAKDPNITSSSIGSKLEAAGLRGGNVKISTIGNDRIAILSLPPTESLKGRQDEIIAKIADAAGFNPADQKGFTEIGPAIQKETLENAVKGVLISSALIAIFLAFRFGFSLGGFVPGLRFGLSAIGALVHDILFVLAFAGFMGHFLNWEISALFITSMLTIIGFSVHDTIVVFDRIRENLRRAKAGENLEHLMDVSITQSFARSINTSMTVIVTLAILVAIGTATLDLKFFVSAMLAGIVSGTYSSIYNAAPILYLWDKSVVKRKGEEAGLVGIALAERRSTITTTTVAPAPAAATRVAKPKPVARPIDEPTEGEAKPNTTVGKDGRTYGQVKRRANQQKQNNYDIED